MPTTEQLRARLIDKLRELFQLDQPDLDFGFYRIMHAKAKEVDAFLTATLPQLIEQAFGGLTAGKKDELQAAYEQAVETARSFGAPDPEAAEPVKKARVALEAAGNTAGDEAEVYDYLYRFFERYYDNGDFVSLRYLTRETEHKAKPYAVPYGGEEVILHWANSDQYYIKTAENFSTFTFDLAQVREFREMGREERILAGIPSGPMKVHFKVVDAGEGEHGNVKTNEERFFILAQERPLDITDSPDGELTIFFEYRADPEKTGQAGAWKNKRNQEAEEKILELLESWTSSLPDDRQKHPLHGYFAMLAYKPQSDYRESRSILARYIAKYTAKNTSDYFIHKDLGGFLKRELDFYIKNEIMQLDNIENADAPAVGSYLGKIRVLRKIAGQLIEFLAQLENFQKKLWLKKKFVVQSDYCITLDRIPEEFYPEIIRNLQQWREWEKLGFLTTACDDQFSLEYTKEPVTHLTVTFPDVQYPFFISLADPKELLITNNFGMKEWKPGSERVVGRRITEKDFFSLHPYLMLDTQFFSTEFKAELLAAIHNLDEQCDGLLIHSENFQALNLLQERYREQVKCIYIDPPYNTGEDGFAYKDSYQHSSWMSSIFDRVSLSRKVLLKNGLFFSSIDFVEEAKLRLICDSVFFDENFLSKIIWEKRFTRSNNAKLFSTLTENILAYRGSSNVTLLREPRNEKADSTYSNPDNDPRGPWTSVSYVNPASKAARPNLTYPLTNPITKEKVNHPTNAWKYERSTYEKHVRENRLYWGQEGGHTYPRLKKFLSEMEGMVPVDLWKHGNTGTTDSASKLLEDEFGKKVFEFPKPPSLVKRIIGVANFGASDGIFLDYFAGTGPTSHAVIDLNREDSGKRKYILVEMGDYFDTVLKPRIEKVVFTKDWKNGKPVSINCNGAGNNDGSGYGMGSGRGAGNENGSGDDLFDLPNEPPEASTGVSHCFKYLRLESYEDTLNNLEFTGGEAFSADPELYKDYLLHYLLDLETQGSASLLSIEAFADPFNYKLKVKKPGGEESELRTVDLPETFNYLLGLRVEQIFAPQRFSAEFERLPDLELPEDQKTKLTIKGRLRLDTEGPWTFRKLEGRIPKNRFTPNDGVTEKVLVIWRVLTGDQEQDNLVLDEFFRRECMNPKDTEFDTIYVNGSNNLPNLKRDGDNWKVRLIEEDFMNRMWEVE